jgi:hypothetical protein
LNLKASTWAGPLAVISAEVKPVYMSAHIKPDSVDSYLSSICNRLEDHFQEVRKNRNSHLVSKTLAGCKRMRGTATKREHPLSVQDLAIVTRWLLDRVALGVANHDDFLFTSQLLTGFYELLRLGELTRAAVSVIRGENLDRGPPTESVSRA